MAQGEITIGRTGSAVYMLRGAWVYRQPTSNTWRFDTLEGFVAEISPKC